MQYADPNTSNSALTSHNVYSVKPGWKPPFAHEAPYQDNRGIYPPTREKMEPWLVSRIIAEQCQGRGLSANARYMLNILGQFLNVSSMQATVSVQRLEDRSGRSERSVRYGLKELRLAGVINTMRRTISNRQRSNTYILAMPVKWAWNLAEKIRNWRPFKRRDRVEELRGADSAVRTPSSDINSADWRDKLIDSQILDPP